MGSLRVGFANLLWFCYSAYMSRKWKRAARDVAGAQQSVLKHILASNRNCEFGREHHFHEITSFETYSQRVPVRAYEDFEAYIERVAGGYSEILTEQPVQQLGPVRKLLLLAAWADLAEPFLPDVRHVGRNHDQRVLGVWHL